MTSNNRGNQNESISDSYKIMNQIVKEQNKRLLIEISMLKNMDEETAKEFINDYLKPNYYMLEITLSRKKEQRQRNYIF